MQGKIIPSKALRHRLKHDGAQNVLQFIAKLPENRRKDNFLRTSP